LIVLVFTAFLSPQNIYLCSSSSSFPPPLQRVMSQTGLSPSSSSVPLSAAENYQLKWNSHVTNLNSSISSLFKNDKYADVMLLTCNSEEGYCGIPAHKLILGTCSHVSNE
jgi:hypothetical protein